MSKRTTFPKLAIALVASLAVSSQSASAQSGDKAEGLNTQGKALFKERRYLEAYRAFKQATELSPQGRYYFNLCFSLNYLERFQEAIDACEQVEANGADAKLMKKTNAVLGALRAKVPAPTPDPVDPNPVDPDNPNPVDPTNPDPVDPNGDPNTPPGPNTSDPNATTNPDAATSTGPATVPGLDPFAVKKPSGAYEWSIGGGLAPLSNIGVGRGGDMGDFYSGSGFKLGLFANFMYKEAQRIGLQGYFGLTTLPEDAAFDPMTILDFGGAAFKHIKIAGNLDVTPLVGLHVALLQPEPTEAEALVALGAKAQVSLDWAFGKSKEHVLSFAPSLNLYSAGSDSNTLNAATYGLDSGGAALAFNIGYQYRFTTPFGSSPLFTLE